MKHDIFPMTEAGFERLQQELEQLETVKRERAKQRIKHARSFCDFQEDSEYEQALKERVNIEERISMLQYKIQQAEIIKKTGKTQVELGNTISFKEMPSGNIETYIIVGTEEADPLEGKISSNSPIAKSLLGAEVNDIVTVKTPSGNWQLKIVDVS